MELRLKKGMLITLHTLNSAIIEFSFLFSSEKVT